MAGAAFAFAWTPCVGPTLGSILTAASVSDTVAKGGVLLLFYSLGLAVPFLLTARRLHPRHDARSAGCATATWSSRRSPASS